MLLQSIVAASLLLLNAVGCIGVDKEAYIELDNEFDNDISYPTPIEPTGDSDDNELHQTNWSWKIDNVDEYLDEIKFKFFVKYAELKPYNVNFWYVSHRMSMAGPEMYDQLTYVAWLPISLPGGKKGVRTLFVSQAPNTRTAALNCEKKLNAVFCEKTFEVPYESLWTITVKKSNTTTLNSWHAYFEVAGQEVSLGAMIFADRYKGIKPSHMGMVYDLSKHHMCTMKIPFYVDIYPPEAQGVAGKIYNWRTSGHCPDEDPRYWFEYRNGTWGYWET